MGWRAGEVGHEVDDDVEDEDLDEDQRDVDDGLRDGKGGGAVELESLVFKEDGAGCECRLEKSTLSVADIFHDVSLLYSP